MTSWQRILNDLRRARSRGEWVCGNDWYRAAMPTFAQRISLDLRPKGFVIESEVCKEHDHQSTVHRYRLLREPDPTQLALV